MTKYQILEHGIEASRITALKPLVIRGMYVPPAEGIVIVLEDGSAQTWRRGLGVEPVVGDWYISDPVLAIHCVVAEAIFDYMFEAAPAGSL